MTCVNCGRDTPEGVPFCIDNAPLRSGKAVVKSLCCIDHIKMCGAFIRAGHKNEDFIEQYHIWKQEWVNWLADI